jgi:hypothetical protein
MTSTIEKKTATIAFQSLIEGDVVHIPEQYRGRVEPLVTVLLTPQKTRAEKIKARSKTKPFTLDDFSAIKLDTRGWQFNRDEANER